jgi:hypothetical protein
MKTPGLLLRQRIATEEAGEKAAAAGRPVPIQNILFTFTEYCKVGIIVMIGKINFYIQYKDGKVISSKGMSCEINHLFWSLDAGYKSH